MLSVRLYIYKLSSIYTKIQVQQIKSKEREPLSSILKLMNAMNASDRKIITH